MPNRLKMSTLPILNPTIPPFLHVRCSRLPATRGAEIMTVVEAVRGARDGSPRNLSLRTAPLHSTAHSKIFHLGWQRKRWSSITLPTVNTLVQTTPESRQHANFPKCPRFVEGATGYRHSCWLKLGHEVRSPSARSVCLTCARKSHSDRHHSAPCRPMGKTKASRAQKQRRAAEAQLPAADRAAMQNEYSQRPAAKAARVARPPPMSRTEAQWTEERQRCKRVRRWMRRHHFDYSNLDSTRNAAAPPATASTPAASLVAVPLAALPAAMPLAALPAAMPAAAPTATPAPVNAQAAAQLLQGLGDCAVVAASAEAQETCKERRKRKERNRLREREKTRVRDRATVPGRKRGRPPNSSYSTEELQHRTEQRKQQKSEIQQYFEQQDAERRRAEEAYARERGFSTAQEYRECRLQSYLSCGHDRPSGDGSGVCECGRAFGEFRAAVVQQVGRHRNGSLSCAREFQSEADAEAALQNRATSEAPASVQTRASPPSCSEAYARGAMLIGRTCHRWCVGCESPGHKYGRADATDGHWYCKGCWEAWDPTVPSFHI